MRVTDSIPLGPPTLTMFTANVVETLKGGGERTDGHRYIERQCKLQAFRCLFNKLAFTLRVRCAFFDRKFALRMPLVPTPVRLKQSCMRLINSMPLGWAQSLLQVDTAHCVQTLKALLLEHCYTLVRQPGQG
jgi:hypothetical protein